MNEKELYKRIKNLETKIDIFLNAQVNINKIDKDRIDVLDHNMDLIKTTLKKIAELGTEQEVGIKQLESKMGMQKMEMEGRIDQLEKALTTKSKFTSLDDVDKIARERVEGKGNTKVEFNH